YVQCSHRGVSSRLEFVAAIAKASEYFEVFTFGSVPLKTYLPDGDIDLSAFSNNPSLKDTWASRISLMLDADTLQFRRRQKAGESWLSHPKQTVLKNRSKTKAAGTHVYHDSLKKLKSFADYQTVRILNFKFPRILRSSADRPAAERGRFKHAYA
ncbi:arginine N-methyltransferase 1.1-like protein, partial [Tanacetum coccineum]